MSASIVAQPSLASQKTLRTRTSLSSLRRGADKEKDRAFYTAPMHSSPRPSYFDVYPTRAPATNIITKEKEKDDGARYNGKEKLVAWPTVNGLLADAVEPSPSPRKVNPLKTSPTPSSRPRFRSNPADTPVPDLRSSGSTVETGTLTPPRTPVASFSSLHKVEVAAPVSGVETMDALVDGMNGGLSSHLDYLSYSDSTPRAGKSDKRKHIYHPLYHPPLPTPPRGIQLGGAIPRPPASPFTDSDDEQPRRKQAPSPSRPKRRRPALQVESESDSPTKQPSGRAARSPAAELVLGQNRQHKSTVAGGVKTKPVRGEPTVVPSISQIIQAHDSAKSPNPSALTSYKSKVLPSLFPSTPEEEEGLSTARSSIDSITLEVQSSLKTARSLHHARSFPSRPIVPDYSRRNSSISDRSYTTSARSYTTSARSYTTSTAQFASTYARSEDPHEPTLSIYSSDATTPTNSHFGGPRSSPYSTPPSSTQAIAQYLRSPRLTRLVTLSRPPYRGLTVSLADVGSISGLPVLVFLGLGCVRYLIALYDEMAEALGLRLICIDRWGLGKTDDLGSDACEKRGVREWAGVCEEVLDKMGVGNVAVMAHSAGAPYALAFSLRVGPRALGSVHLLAPWVGGDVEGAGYKWLKYVPNGLIKTAQAAEWKVHGWRLGKPPTVAFEGIGYDVKFPVSPEVGSKECDYSGDSLAPPIVGSPPGRPSFSASDYDDLADFGGRFSSSTTLGGQSPRDQSTAKRKQTRSLFGRWKGTGSPSPQNTNASMASSKPGSNPKPPKLKGLKSMSSLKSSRGNGKQEVTIAKPVLPDVRQDSSRFGLGFDVEFGLDPDELLAKKHHGSSLGHGHTARAISPPPPSVANTFPRTRRSISLTSASTPPSSLIHSHPPRSPTAPSSISPQTLVPQASNLANALIRASHHEASRGQTGDLLAILERDSRPWGFSYADVRHQVKVWYGDKDEKIGEGAIRWMERIMKDCKVYICKGQDHALMANAGIVVEVLESIQRESSRRTVPSF